MKLTTQNTLKNMATGTMLMALTLSSLAFAKAPAGKALTKTKTVERTNTASKTLDTHKIELSASTRRAFESAKKVVPAEQHIQLLGAAKLAELAEVAVTDKVLTDALEKASGNEDTEAVLLSLAGQRQDVLEQLMASKSLNRDEATAFLNGQIKNTVEACKKSNKG